MTKSHHRVFRRSFPKFPDGDDHSAIFGAAVDFGEGLKQNTHVVIGLLIPNMKSPDSLAKVPLVQSVIVFVLGLVLRVHHDHPTADLDHINRGVDDSNGVVAVIDAVLGPYKIERAGRKSLCEKLAVTPARSNHRRNTKPIQN